MTFKVKDGIAIAGTTFVDGSRNITAGNITAGTVTAALSGNATTATNVAWSGITSKPTTISGFGITDAPTSTGTGASGTWSINVTGNAGTATTLQTTRTINGTNFNGSANIDTTEWIHSGRDFPLGTLVQTTINYSVTAGDPWVLEIKGNAYGSLIPFDIQYQGYIYTDTIINHGGYSNGTNITGLVVFNYNGKLCFWWPSQTYWHGYNIRVYTAQATRALNKVTTITNEAKPAGVTKEVALSANIRQSLHSTNYNSYSPTLTGTGASGTWGISITGNAATVTNGVYTNGSYADPAWITSLAKSKVGLANVENTALSTWAGSTNITTIGAATASSLSVTGNLTVNGTTTTVNSTTVTLDDPILTLGGDTAPTVDDNKDRGIEFRWHNGTAAKVGFFGYDDSTGYLTFIPDATNTSEVFSGTQGDIQATNFRGALVGNAATATTATNLSGGTVSATTGTFSSTLTSSFAPAAINTATPGLTNYGFIFNGSSSTDNAQGITWTWATSGAAQAGIYVQSSGNYGTKMYIATTDSFATGSRTAISIDHTGLTNFVRARPTALGNTILDAGNYTSYSPTLTGTGATGTWSINVTGSAGSASTATNSTQLGGIAAANYIYGSNASGSNALSATQNVYELGQYKSGFWEINGASWTPNTNWWWGATFAHRSNTSSYNYSGQLAFAISGGGDNVYARTIDAGTPTAWARLLSSGNYNSYSPTLTGGGATGTWSINVTGNAATVTNGVYLTTVQTLTNKTLSSPVLTSYQETVTTATISTTTYNIDTSLGNIFEFTLSSNVTFTFTNPVASGRAKPITVILRQDATGGRTATFTGARYTDGQLPQLSTGANQIDVLTFYSTNGGSWYFGTFAMANVS